MTTNFGKIGGQRIITFRKCLGNSVRAEAFRRWKIARKAWKTRKANQAQRILEV